MWTDARLLNLLAAAMSVVAALLLALAALSWFVQRPAWEIRAIELRGAAGPLEHVRATAVRQTIQGRLTGNFFTADLAQVRQVFEAVPWVRQAAVRRVWPNRLQVTVEEHRAMAIWNEAQFLNVQGESFTANLGDVDQPLPALSGPPGSESRVHRRHAELLDWLAPLPGRIVALELSPRYAWQVRLDSGLTILLGRDPASPTEGLPMQQRVQRFVQSLPQVESELGRPVRHVDLRHTQGFAIHAEGALAAKPPSPQPMIPQRIDP